MRTLSVIYNPHHTYMAVKNGKTASADNTNTNVSTGQNDTLPQVGLGGRYRAESERRASAAKFAEPVYNKPISKAPIAQVINNQDATKVGLFIKEDALDTIKWKGEPATHTHIFSGNTEERGVLLQSPAMNIIQVSNRFIELRESSEDGTKAGTLLNMVFESPDGYEFYQANKDKYVLRRFYFVFVLGEDGENLHEIPIAISLKGVAMTKFGLALTSFRESMETAFAAQYNVTKASKVDEFHRLGIFKPKFVPSHEPKTEPNPRKRSWVAIIDEFDAPNPDGSDFFNFFCDWKEQKYNEFVVTNPDLVKNINKAAPIIEEHNRLVLKGRQNAGLLPGANVIDVEAREDDDNIPY